MGKMGQVVTTKLACMIFVSLGVLGQFVSILKLVLSLALNIKERKIRYHHTNDKKTKHPY